ncbi:hypothetical protein CYLTODRAFT_427696 [Cylindrobasidium torrendii FP15055 ss-10]|uniref:Uncharacterized protein n=1 Tax=Cylindrobasidium torrendii FP15055 ss-10 TaxID=1314674 RepID=A0A0D7AST3_9AGAR|nr:hypothetical protein CYLTODRAFT_427696 [Cylindrobasidium torrendii FP15055 ss-10]
MSDFISNEVPQWVGMDPAYPLGRCGAQFDDLIVVSPNAGVVYLPMYGQNRTLRLREDYRWGVDDYMNIPQPYSSIHPIRVPFCFTA